MSVSVQESQSLSGWDGVFHSTAIFWWQTLWTCRNPFQGGMGFFTYWYGPGYYAGAVRSQSLSGWDGVFHEGTFQIFPVDGPSGRNPFQGGMGFFTVGIPDYAMHGDTRRNPFQGGMGFFTLEELRRQMAQLASQSLSGWDGVFH